MTVTTEDEPSLTRAQKRHLRRIYNGRTVPITVDGQSFLTYKEASRHILSRAPEDREAAYAAMKEQAKLPLR